MASNGFRLSAELDVTLGSNALSTVRQLKKEIRESKIQVQIGIPDRAGQKLKIVAERMTKMNTTLDTLNPKLLTFGKNLKEIPADKVRDIQSTTQQLQNLTKSLKTLERIQSKSNIFLATRKELGQTRRELSKANEQISRFKNVRKELDSTKEKLKEVSREAKSFDSASKAFERGGTRIKSTTQKVEEFGRQSALAFKRFGAFAVVTSGVFRLQSALATSIRQAIDFQNQMVRLSQVSKDFDSTIAGVGETISRVSTEYGVLSTELASVSVTLAQTGISADKVRIALDAIALTDLAPTFNNITQTTEASIAILAQFGLEVEDLYGSLGSINAVAASFAVESEDIAIAIRKAGGAFAAAGANLNELIALFTSVRATSRESADTIATALRTIVARIQRVETQDFLKQFGIDLRDAENQFVGPFKAIQRISQALRDVPTTDPIFAQIVERIGGVRQLSKVIPLIKQSKLALEAYAVAQAGAGSLDDERVLSQKSLERQFIKTREAFNEMIRGFTQDESIQNLVKQILSLTRSLLKFVETLKIAASAIPPLFVGSIFRFSLPFARGFFGKGDFPVKRNSGGFVPGQGNRDTVQALLTPGEFVINKRSAKFIGKDRLEELNSLPKFASGGAVGNIAGNRKALGIGLAAPLAIQVFGNLSQEAQVFTTALGAAVLELFALKSIGLDLGGTLKDFEKTTRTINRLGPEGTRKQEIRTVTNSRFIAPLQNQREELLGRARNLRERADFERRSLAAEEFSDAQFGLDPRRKEAKVRRARAIGAANAFRAEEDLVTSQIRNIDREIDTNVERRIERRNKLREGRRAKRFRSGAVGAGAVGGVLAGFAGEVISNRGFNQIEERGTGSGLAVAGSTISGIGQGAAIGAAVGGIPGAVIGGAAYGLYSFVDSLSKAERAVRDFDFNKIFGKAADSLEAVLAGDSTVIRSENQVSAGARQAITRLAGTSGEERATIEGQIGRQLPNFVRFLNKVSEESDSMEELVARTKDTVKLIALIRDVPVEEVTKELKEMREEAKKASEAAEKLSKDFDSMQRVISLTIALQNSFNRVLASTEKLLGTVDNSFNLANNQDLSFSQVDVGKAFSNASSGLVTKQFENIIKNVSGVFGSGSQKFEERVLDSAKVSGAIADILADVKASSPTDDGDFVDQVLNRVAKVTQNQDILNLIEGSLASTRDSNLDKINNDFSALIEQLQGSLSPITDEAKKLAENFQEMGRTIDPLLSRRRQTRDNISGLNRSRRDVDRNLDDFLRNFNNDPRTTGEAKQLDIEDTADTLSGNPLLSNVNPASSNIVNNLAATRQNLVASLDKTQEELDKAVGTPKFAELLVQRDNEAQAIEKVNRALNGLADQSNVLKAAQDRLSKLQASRQQGLEFGSSFVFGDNTQRREQQRAFSFARSAISSGSLENIPSSARGDIKSIFRALSSVEVFEDAQGNKLSGQEAEKQLVLETLKNLGFDGLNLEDIILPGQEEKDLLQKIKDEASLQTEAINALIDIQKDVESGLTDAIQELLKQFKTDTKETQRQEEGKVVQGRIDQNFKQYLATQEKLNIVEDLKQKGFSEDEIKVLSSKRNQESIQSLEKTSKNVDSLTIARDELFDARLENTSTLGQILPISETAIQVVGRLTGNKESNAVDDGIRGLQEIYTPNLNRRDSIKFAEGLNERLVNAGVDESLLPTARDLSTVGIGELNDIPKNDILKLYEDVIRENKAAEFAKVQTAEEALKSSGIDPVSSRRFIENKDTFDKLGNVESIEELEKRKKRLEKEITEDQQLQIDRNLPSKTSFSGATTTQNKPSIADDKALAGFSDSTTIFQNSTRSFEQSVKNIPSEISLDGKHQVEVVINGVEAFANMESSIQNLVTNEINSSINQFMQNNLKMPGTFKRNV